MRHLSLKELSKAAEREANGENTPYALKFFSQYKFKVKDVFLSLDLKIMKEDINDFLTENEELKNAINVNNLSGVDTKLFDDNYFLSGVEFSEELLWINLLNEFVHLDKSYENTTLENILADENFVLTVENNVNSNSVNLYSFLTTEVANSAAYYTIEKGNKRRVVIPVYMSDNYNLFSFESLSTPKERDALLTLTPKSLEFILLKLKSFRETGLKDDLLSKTVCLNTCHFSYANLAEKRECVKTIISTVEDYIAHANNGYTVNTVFTDVVSLEYDKKKILVDYLSSFENSTDDCLNLNLSQLEMADFLDKGIAKSVALMQGNTFDANKYVSILNLLGKDYIENHMTLARFYVLNWAVLDKKRTLTKGLGTEWNLTFAQEFLKTFADSAESKDAIIDLIFDLNYKYEYLDEDYDTSKYAIEKLLNSYHLGLPSDLLLNIVGTDYKETSGIEHFLSGNKKALSKLYELNI